MTIDYSYRFRTGVYDITDFNISIFQVSLKTESIPPAGSKLVRPKPGVPFALHAIDPALDYTDFG